MRELIGVHVGGMVKEEEEVVLCFDWETDDKENASSIKARYGNRKFFTTGFKTKNVDSIITKIEIDTFDSIKNERMNPMYDFMKIVMDDLTAVKKYTAEELKELFTEHFPETMYINIWCTDKLLRASVDHKGEPRWRFSREDIVDGVRNSGAPWIKNPKPLELVVEELGL